MMGRYQIGYLVPSRPGQEVHFSGCRGGHMIAGGWEEWSVWEGEVGDSSGSHHSQTQPVGPGLFQS